MSIIFTTHAEERMRKRKMARFDIERTLKNPDQSFPGKKAETVKFIKHIDSRRHEVVAKYLKDQNSWLILSVWIRGEDDPASWIEWIVLAPFKLVVWCFKKVVKK